ncbi:LAFA_0F07338g1_1 [Lachancea sp. 'fantastica']|nr:LAFA_0F07338g1_1 [Lachancea sp. 'fantastica']
MPKENLIFKLDNLEYQFHHLNGTLNDFKPRLKNTARTFNAKGKKTSKKISKLLESANLNETNVQLTSLRAEIVQKKAFHLENKLTSLLEKTLQQQYSTLLKKHNQKNEDKLKTLKTLDEKYTLPVFCKLFAKSRVCKLLVAKITPTKTAKADPPVWFKDSEYFLAAQDKTHTYNPSRVWNEVVVSTSGCEKLLSQTMAGPKIKELMSAFDSGMDMFLNNKKTKEVELPSVSAKKEEAEESDSDSGSESEESDDDGSNAEVPEDVDEDEILKQYEGLLVGSDDEDNDVAASSLDPTINYNEITDEEPSEDSEGEDDLASSEDSDSDSEDKPASKRQKTEKAPGKDKKTTKKAVLPELMAGYYSGGSDDEFSDADVAPEPIDNAPKRKNRRGQRARQKIWEKKFGKTANHVQKRMQEAQSERQQRQVEYEQRVAKRESKAREREEAQARHNSEQKRPEQISKSTQVHPSWEAKKQAEEKQKAAKFQGKKIVF